MHLSRTTSVLRGTDVITELVAGERTTLTFHIPAGFALRQATAAPGAILTAEAKEINRTRKTATYDIRVQDETGALIAICTALVYRKGTPLPFLE